MACCWLSEKPPRVALNPQSLRSTAPSCKTLQDVQRFAVGRLTAFGSKALKFNFHRLQPPKVARATTAPRLNHANANKQTKDPADEPLEVGCLENF